MFVYIAYEDLRNKYLDTQRKYDEILKEKEELFQRTQPKAIDYSKEKINAGHSYNAFDSYLIAKEKAKVDERLKEIKSILDDRERLLQLKEQELRSSKNHIDQIYKMRYLDCSNINIISMNSCYSRSQVYKILKRIEYEVKQKSCTNDSKIAHKHETK